MEQEAKVARTVRTEARAREAWTETCLESSLSHSTALRLLVATLFRRPLRGLQQVLRLILLHIKVTLDLLRLCILFLRLCPLLESPLACLLSHSPHRRFPPPRPRRCFPTSYPRRARSRRRIPPRRCWDGRRSPTGNPAGRSRPSRPPALDGSRRKRPGKSGERALRARRTPSTTATTPEALSAAACSPR